MTQLKTSQYPRWSDEELQTLQNIYSQCKLKTLLQNFPKRTERAIYARATMLGLTKQDAGLSIRKGNLSALLNDSNISLYWIGYLFADGSLDFKQKRISASTVKIDLDHIQKLADYVGATVRNHLNKGNPRLGIRPGNLYTFGVCHPEKFNELVLKWDFKPSKTYNPPSISVLQTNLNSVDRFLSFLSGFIDGDGCISTNARGYTYLIINNHSSWNFVLQWFIDQLKIYGIYHGISSASITKRGYSTIQLSGVITKIRSEICPLGLPVLRRKWEWDSVGEQ